MDIIVIVPNPKNFSFIPASAAYGAAVNPNRIKTLLANGLITFFIKDNPVFSNGLGSLPRNSPDCIILDKWVFHSLISVDELFAKALQRFATCLLGNNNSCGKLVLSSELIMTFDENLEITYVSLFNTDCK